MSEAESKDLLSFSWIFGLIVIFVIYILFKRKNKKISGNLLLLIGENGSGKTNLIYQLSNKAMIQTVSSLEPVETTINLELSDNKKINVNCIDIPGHHHYRDLTYKKLKEGKGIIIMVDSTDNKTDHYLAENLYNILTHKTYIENECPILIALNKIDLISARKINVIEEELIQEIIKQSRRALTEENDEFDDFLKNETKRFSFGEFDIKFCEISVLNNELKGIFNFLKDLYA